MSAREAIGVLGGTFDPVHLGHLAIARLARLALGIDRVLLLPTGIPPHKHPPRLAPASDRLAMLELAVQDSEDLSVCTLESDRDAVSYTIDSLRWLRENDPERDPVFIMGLDSLFDLPTWRDHRSLIREFDLVVFDRAGPDLRSARGDLDAEIERRLVRFGDGERTSPVPQDLGRGGRILHLPLQPIPISSRDIRSRVVSLEPLDGLVPPGVARYIRTHGLYRREDAS